jgi:hypothetical protein
MSSRTATITQHDDAGGAEYLRDEYGNLWHAVLDAMDGTLAVEEVTSGERRDPCGQAGVYEFSEGGTGCIWLKEDGQTYGVNCQDEYIARGGEWKENA